jgi:hypothetical protein
MSVTNPTFMPLALEPLDDVLEPVLVLLLLLLLPHAAMPMASAAVASPTNPESLIRLPVTRSPFKMTNRSARIAGQMD